LLADKFEKLQVFDRYGTQFKLTQPRWVKYGTLRKQYEGWASVLRAEHGHDVVRFLEQSSILDEQVESVDDAIRLVQRDRDEDAVYTTELLDQDDEIIRVRAVEKKSGLAQTHRIPRGLFEAPEYRSFVRVHRQLVELAGTPPFTVQLADRTDEALSFEALRAAVMGVAQRGVSLNRFKGLGEMNPEQLRTTTMDPASRTLQQVSIEDAAEADRIFSMLMGEVVDKRRAFIEDNALAASVDV
jgi:DNA gyrase subunit B